VTLIPLPDKATRDEISVGGKKALNFAQRVFRVAQIERENMNAIKILQAEVAVLKEQVRSLTEREALLIAKMEAAVTRAAAESTSELARRIGFLEGRASRD
jgi:hypothetical protein